MATREIYWNISFHWLLYPLLVAALGIFAYGFYRRARLWAQGTRGADGTKGERQHKIVRGVVDVLGYGFGHRRTATEAYPGVMHIFMFWGAVLLFFATAMVALQADLGAEVFRGDLYLFVKSTANGFGLLVLAGIAMAAWRRYVLRPKRLDNRADDAITLGLLTIIVITGFVVQGARMAAIPDPWARWGFVGDWLSRAFAAGFSPSGLLVFHRAVWWFHLALVFGLVAYLPYSKLFHVLLAPANQFMRPRGAVGVQNLIDFEDESIESYGVAKLADLPRKTLFDTDVCLRCGRCRDACPATASGKHLDPKAAIQDIRGLMEETGRAASRPRGLVGEVVPEADLWSCTTCRACEAACPVFIGHVDKTLNMRRHLVLMRSNFPTSARLVFDNIEVNGNPLGESALTRGDYLRGLGVPTIAERPDAEVLWWPGCSGNLDVRAQKVSASLARLLRAAEVSFATLANEEKCCGDPARRLGNEYLFQMLATENIETINRYGLRRIVTQCPHCLAVLKNEYPAMGATFEVLHHSEFLDELMADGRLRLGPSEAYRVTYHDSCYLGRYSGTYTAPRTLLQTAGHQLVELPRNKAKAFCCGGGGGRMWLEENEGERINNLRADQVLSVAPEIAAVACPYCLTMLRDGIAARQADERVRVMDIAEILEARLDPSARLSD